MGRLDELFYYIFDEAGVAPQASGFNVTTTAPNQTLTIGSFGFSEETTVDWGDGDSDAFTGTAQRTHEYADAGTYSITIDLPENVVTLDISDSKVTLNSSGLQDMVNLEVFFASGIGSGQFNSVDFSNMTSLTRFGLSAMLAGYTGEFNSADLANATGMQRFYLHTMPSGYEGHFDSVDFANMTSLQQFYLHTMPAGYTGEFDSADFSSISTLTQFYMASMPVGFVFTISNDSDFSGWVNMVDIQMRGTGMTQVQVDTILFSLYSMGTNRVASNGRIRIDGSNASPSGTNQPAVSCPVDTNTPGREVANELLNDGCAVGFNTWATVTTS